MEEDARVNEARVSADLTESGMLSHVHMYVCLHVNNYFVSCTTQPIGR